MTDHTTGHALRGQHSEVAAIPPVATTLLYFDSYVCYECSSYHVTPLTSHNSPIPVVEVRRPIGVAAAIPRLKCISYLAVPATMLRC